jgi:hypothetical protein
MMEKELEGREGYLVEPEPEVVPAVEGDKFETCPTCGGPCKRIPADLDDYRSVERYKSLVKGEVVAEGSSCLRVDNPTLGIYWIVSNPSESFTDAEQDHVLVVRAARKENAGTGGKE